MDRISVVMAPFNGEKYIEEQILSICNQTVKPTEIIISDDGSSDVAIEIVRKFEKNQRDAYLSNRVVG